MFWDSSEELTTNQATGNSNVATVNISEPVHIEHDLMIYCLVIITIVKILELLYILYRAHQRRLKKRYGQQPGPYASQYALNNINTGPNNNPTR